jgi:HAD superfamily hydrolase (TIGR01509 family)
MTPQGAIFDMDGTLIDSMPIWDTLGETYLRRRGIVPPPGLRELLRPMSLPEAAQYFRVEFGIPDPVDEVLSQFDTLICDQYRNKVGLKPGVLPFLQRLRSQGVRMCIATATGCELAETALRRLGIADFFEFILTCADVGSGKSNPAIFSRALELLGTHIDSTIVFEDALHAIHTAKQAGFTVVGVFDLSAADDAAEISKLADGYILSFDEWKE